MDNLAITVDQTSGLFKSNTQAMMEFGRIWAAGCRNLSDIMMSNSQAHFDHITTTMKAMSDVRTIKGAMELQIAATRTLVEQAIAHSGKLSIASIEMASNGTVPIKSLMDVSMARFNSMHPN